MMIRYPDGLSYVELLHVRVKTIHKRKTCIPRGVCHGIEMYYKREILKVNASPARLNSLNALFIRFVNVRTVRTSRKGTSRIVSTYMYGWLTGYTHPRSQRNKRNLQVIVVKCTHVSSGARHTHVYITVYCCCR